MCVHDATILRCASTFSRRLKRSSAPYAKSIGAFNTHYKKMGETTVKIFPDPLEVRQVLRSSKLEGGKPAYVTV